MSEPTRTSKEQFDRQAAHYDGQWNSWTEESLKWLIERARCRGDEELLDVATGTGFTALGFAPYVKSVVGLDVSTGMLAQAERRAAERGAENVTLREGAAEALPFPDGSFDIVTCRIAPHHFVDIRQFVRESARVLRPGGSFLLGDTTVPDDPIADRWQNNVERVRDPSHVRNYTATEWRDFVGIAGLSIREITDQGGGIRVPISDWLTKAGCTERQCAIVRNEFQTAPPAAHEAFQIERDADGEINFTWQRILIHATKLIRNA